MTERNSTRLWAYVLGAYFGALALIAFCPSPVDAPVQGQLATALSWLHSHGVPSWFNYNVVEASANVALFVPIGFAGKMALSRASCWRVTACGLLISGCIELGQLLLLPHRFASILDVATNTVGALLGALLAQALSKRARKRRAGF
jgi:glycopeptide antibiotics resistance protein